MMRRCDGALRLMLLAAFAMYLWSCGSTRYSGSILNRQRPLPPPQAADSVDVLYHFAGGTEVKPGRVPIEWVADTMGTFQITKKQLEAIIYPAKYSREDRLTVSYERRYESRLIVHWDSHGEVVDSSDTIAIPYARLVRMDCDAMRRYAPNVPDGNRVVFEKFHTVLRGSTRIPLDTDDKKISLSLGREPAPTLFKCDTICKNPMNPDSTTF